VLPPQEPPRRNTIFEITTALDGCSVLFDFMGAGDVLDLLASVGARLERLGRSESDQKTRRTTRGNNASASRIPLPLQGPPFRFRFKDPTVALPQIPLRFYIVY